MEKDIKNIGTDIPNLDEEALILANEICEKQLEVMELQKKQLIVQEYKNAVDCKLLDFIDNYSHGKNIENNWDRYQIGEITNRQARDIERLLGFNVSNYMQVIKPNAIRHIESRHGEHGEHDKSMSDKKNIARVKYVLDNYDSIEPAEKEEFCYMNSDKSRAKGVVYCKRINGNFYVVEVVPESKNKLAYVHSAYMKKAELEKQAPQNELTSAECKTLSCDAQNVLASPHTYSIPQIKTKVKPLNKKDRGDLER